MNFWILVVVIIILSIMFWKWEARREIILEGVIIGVIGGILISFITDADYRRSVVEPMRELIYEIGPLNVKVKKGSGQVTDFRVENPEDKSVHESVRFIAESPINNIIFSKGNEYFTKKDGGIGNNYIDYDVKIPPNTVVTGNAVSGTLVTLTPIFEQKSLIEDK